MLKKFGVATPKSILGLSLAVCAAAACASSAQAQVAPFQGNFRTAVCDSVGNYFVPIPTSVSSQSPQAAATGGGGATSQFITLTGDQATGGFGFTSAGARLAQKGNGAVAALNLRLIYPPPPGNADQNFILGQINVKGTGQGTPKKDTILRFCFQDAAGTGQVVTASLRLNTLPVITTENGFQRVQIAPSNFSINVTNMVLRKLSIQLSNNEAKQNSLTVGDVDIYTNVGPFQPVGINLTKAGCNSLTSCPSSSSSED